MTTEKLADLIAIAIEPLVRVHEANLVPGDALDHALDRSHLQLMKLFADAQRENTTAAK